MYDRRSDKNNIEEENLDEVFSLEEGIEEASKEEEQESHHGESKHHEPLGIEHISLKE